MSPARPGVPKGCLYLVLSTRGRSTGSPEPCPAPGAIMGTHQPCPGKLSCTGTPQLCPRLSSSRALWDSSPAAEAQPQALGITWHMAFRRTGDTKIHCKLMFYLSIYIKHVAKVKKPSTSVIQNIVVVQETINAAFIQIPTA